MKRGFTLVELLAVLVILAIVVLILIPIVSDVINSSDTNAKKRSIDLYAKAISDGLSVYQVDNPIELIANKTYTTEELEKIITVKYNGNKVSCNKIFVKNDASITLEECTVDGEEVDYAYGIPKETPDIKTPYTDSILNGSDPILFDETLTPVIYDGTNWVVADPYNKWYDYDNQEWANAVILKTSKNIGDTVNIDGFDSDIYAIYVWIPRYEYKMSDAASTSVTEININFISKETTTPTDGYAINSGFTFGSTNLSGIWVGKFETSHVTLSSSTTNNNLGCTNESCTNADDLRIVPNVQSLRYNNVSNFFFASRSMGRNGNPFGIDSTITDSHMMKNSEWGIVAYLSLSKYGKYGNSNYTGANKEVYINNSSGLYTGRSGGAPSGSTPINETYTTESSTDQYNTYGFYTYDDYLLNYNTNTKESKVTSKGTGASTTGNIYGVYDMSGEAYEYVMGVFANSNGELWSGQSATYNSGFTGKLGTSGNDYTGISFPNTKYYDVYKASSGTTMTSSLACNGGICYGHAVSPEVPSWYSDYSNFVSASSPWFIRGGLYSTGAGAGVAYRISNSGNVHSLISFRLVLSEA